MYLDIVYLVYRFQLCFISDLPALLWPSAPFCSNHWVQYFTSYPTRSQRNSNTIEDLSNGRQWTRVNEFMPENTANHGLLCFAIWIYALLLAFAFPVKCTSILSHYRVCDGRRSEPAAFTLRQFVLLWLFLCCWVYRSVRLPFPGKWVRGVWHVFSFCCESPCVGSAKIFLHGLLEQKERQ